jgi:alpha-tubulin suppressor-like RCC1 family protein
VARISGSTESDGRVIIVDETSGAVEFTEEVTAENAYEANELASGDKIVLFRADNGETVGYSEVATVDTILRTNLLAFGANSNYCLGDGTNEHRSSPTIVTLDSSKNPYWSEIDPGNSFVIALKAGTLWSWGYNGYGQLGQGDTTDRSVPTQIGTDTTWIKVAVGRDHAIALKSDGTLWSWGRNDQGQLGLGDSGGSGEGESEIANRSTLTQIGTDTNWSKIYSGVSHNMAIKSNGQLWSWGLDNYGQLMVNNTINRSTPVQVGALTTWTEAYPGHLHSVAKRVDGTVWVAGHNGFGQFGTNQIPITSSTPVQIGAGNTYNKIAVGYNHTLMIRSDGTLWGAGHNGFGQCGNGTFTNTLVLTQAGTDDDWAHIVCCAFSSFALKSDGTLWSFGLNNTGQLGLGYVAVGNTGESYPTQVGTASNWVKLMLPAQGHSAYIMNSGVEV